MGRRCVEAARNGILAHIPVLIGSNGAELEGRGASHRIRSDDAEIELRRMLPSRLPRSKLGPMAGHPNVRSRVPRSAGMTLRVLVLAADATLTWIVDELTNAAITLQVTSSVDHVVAALVSDPPPRATILVCDFDTLDAAQLVELQQVRERGWFGVIIGLGNVPAPVRKSLAVTHFFAPPFARHARTGGHQTFTSRIRRGTPFLLPIADNLALNAATTTSTKLS